MKDVFQSWKRQPAEKPAAQRVALAAFGKHPAWYDHMPGIGVETEALADAKQSLYVGGIGGQIDSGAWEKLNVTQRLDGFDHTFLWFRTGHTLLGRVWSSKDRKGRAKYPMVLAVEAGEIAPAHLVVKGQPEIARLEEFCKRAQTEEEVTNECRIAQERMRAAMDSEPRAPSPGQDARLRFLESTDFGPDRIGLLRVLHELQSRLGGPGTHRMSKTGSGGASCHLRLPFGCDSAQEAMLLWASFLQCAVAEPAWLLLISRTGVQWLDVIFRKPVSDDFLCLQAALSALPLVTEVPYEISPGLRGELQDLEKRFLSQETPPGAPGQVERVKPAPAPPQPPPAPKEVAPPPVCSSAKKRSAFILALAGACVFAAVIAGLSLAHRSGVADQERKYRTELGAGKSALKRGDYGRAIAGADRALALKPNDLEAQSLKRMAASAADQEKKYQVALASAQSALNQKNYAKAMADADQALGVRTNDSEALKLRESAAQGNLTARADQEKRYQSAVETGRSAFGKKDYVKAMAAADQALALKPNGSEALALKRDAEQTSVAAGAAAAEQERNFQKALTTGRAAFGEKEYAKAIAAAELALAVKPNDRDALQLKHEANEEVRYLTTFQRAQSAFQKKDYAVAITQADQALSLKPDAPEARKLKQEAEKEKRYLGFLVNARAAFDQKDYAKAIGAADEALAVKPGDPEGLKLKQNADRNRSYVEALGRGLAALKQNDPGAALSAAKQALAQIPGGPDAVKLKQDAEQAKAYQDAVANARSAMDQKDFDKAIAAAIQALAVKPNELEAMKIKTEAEQRKNAVTALAEQDQKYRSAIEGGRAALNQKEFAKAIAEADRALSFKPNDPAAAKLKQDALAADNQPRVVAQNTDEKARLDGELERYEVWFGIRKAEPRIVTADGKAAKPLEGRIPNKDAVINKIEALKGRYKQGQSLDADLEKRFQNLREKVLYSF